MPDKDASLQERINVIAKQLAELATEVRATGRDLPADYLVRASDDCLRASDVICFKD